MCLACAARKPDDQPSRFLVPMRRAEAGKRRDEVDAAVTIYGRGKSFDVTGARNNTKRIAEPLDNRSADENAAL